jgi:hypothetical protein
LSESTKINRLSFFIDDPNQTTKKPLVEIERVKLNGEQFSFMFNHNGVWFFFSAVNSEVNKKLFTKFNIYIILANLLKSASVGLGDSGLVSSKKTKSTKNTESRGNKFEEETDSMSYELKPLEKAVIIKTRTWSNLILRLLIHLIMSTRRSLKNLIILLILKQTATG